MLSSLLSFALLALTVQSAVAHPLEERQTTSLDGEIKARGKKYWGTCADSNTINNSQNQALLKSNFGQLTPENSMKWDATEPNRNQFNYGGADTLVNFATQNGKLIRGHTLVWHSQLPGWVNNINDKATLTTVIQTHISNLAGRYKGKLYAWDVVNEMFEENGSYRNSVFYRVLGIDFVRIAFQAARAADPTAKLYINDYNLDSNNAKAQAVVKLVNDLNNQNPGLIDGIGTQAHLTGGQGAGFQGALTLLASSSATEVAVTELDIAQAPSADYVAVTNACLNTPKCVGITVWGVSDAQSWRASSQPLLWNNSFQPKAAYTAVINAL